MVHCCAQGDNSCFQEYQYEKDWIEPVQADYEVALREYNLSSEKGKMTIFTLYFLGIHYEKNDILPIGPIGNISMY